MDPRAIFPIKLGPDSPSPGPPRPPALPSLALFCPLSCVGLVRLSVTVGGRGPQEKQLHKLVTLSSLPCRSPTPHAPLLGSQSTSLQVLLCSCWEGRPTLRQ